MNLLVVQQGHVKLMGAGQDLHQLVLVSYYTTTIGIGTWFRLSGTFYTIQQILRSGIGGIHEYH